MDDSAAHLLEAHHRNVQGGTARAAVFGISDGLVSNVGLVLGTAAAGAAPSVVRLAGLVGLFAGAFSMAAGEYVSMKAQEELLERELDMERREIARRPERERLELAAIFRSRGMHPDTAETLSKEMHRDPDLALETHAREELGINPNDLGSPVKAAGSSFASFLVGGVLPLLPWFFVAGTAAVVASLVLGAVGAIAVGVAVARLSNRPWAKPAARQLGVAAVAVLVGYALGSLAGVTSAV